MPPSVLYGLADLLRHRWRCLRSRGSLRGHGRTIRWDSGICLLPRRLGFLVRVIYAPTWGLLPSAHSPPMASPPTENRSLFWDHHGPLSFAWMLLQASLGLCMCWGAASLPWVIWVLHLWGPQLHMLLLEPRCHHCPQRQWCKSSSLRPVSCFWGNPESQMNTYEPLMFFILFYFTYYFLDKWVTVHSSCPPTGLGGSWWGGWILLGTGACWDGHLDRVHWRVQNLNFSDPSRRVLVCLHISL